MNASLFRGKISRLGSGVHLFFLNTRRYLVFRFPVYVCSRNRYLFRFINAGGLRLFATRPISVNLKYTERFVQFVTWLWAPTVEVKTCGKQKKERWRNTTPRIFSIFIMIAYLATNKYTRFLLLNELDKGNYKIKLPELPSALRIRNIYLYLYLAIPLATSNWYRSSFHSWITLANLDLKLSSTRFAKFVWLAAYWYGLIADGWFLGALSTMVRDFNNSPFINTFCYFSSRYSSQFFFFKWAIVLFSIYFKLKARARLDDFATSEINRKQGCLRGWESLPKNVVTNEWPQKVLFPLDTKH